MPTFQLHIFGFRCNFSSNLTIKTPERCQWRRFGVLASLRSNIEKGDVLLILVLRMHEVISPEILTSSIEVPNVKTSF